jgi:hypothetical protein
MLDFNFREDFKEKHNNYKNRNSMAKEEKGVMDGADTGARLV